jgi:hypothetical protein
MEINMCTLKMHFEGQREWTMEHWEDQDYVICQYGEPIGKTLSKQDAKIILGWLESKAEKIKKKEENFLGADFWPEWECKKCKCKYTKPAGDYPAGRWWMACVSCGEKKK